MNTITNTLVVKQYVALKIAWSLLHLKKIFGDHLNEKPHRYDDLCNDSGCLHIKVFRGGDQEWYNRRRSKAGFL